MPICPSLPGASEGSGDIYFSSFEGGLLCRDCEPSRVEKRLVMVSRNVLAGVAAASDADITGLFDLLNYHITHLTGRPPAASEYLVDMAGKARTPRH